MLDLYEAKLEPSVVLACKGCDSVHNLAVILEGFGYLPLECRDRKEVSETLLDKVPCLAIVCLQQPDAEEICADITGKGDIGLLLLLRHDEKNPGSKASKLGAVEWAHEDIPAEHLLEKLRRMLEK